MVGHSSRNAEGTANAIFRVGKKPIWIGDNDETSATMWIVQGWRFPKRRISETKWLLHWIWFARALACTCLLGSLPTHAAQPVNLNDPIGFFTNVASRLLQSELGVDL